MNPLLIIIASFLRHAVVTGLSCLTLMFSLPEEVRLQVEGAADFVTTSLISALVWVVVKYGKPLLTKWGLLPLILIGFALSLTSCGGSIVTTDNAEGLADLARIIIYNAK